MYFDVDEIAEVALLSASGWEDVLASVPNVLIESFHRWWTCSPCRAHDCAVFVNIDGSIYHPGTYVMSEKIWIRPVFRIIPRTTNILFPGAKVTIGAFNGVIINTFCYPDGNLYDVLCDSVVTRHPFDAETNEFDNSEIREYINSPAFLKGIQHGVFDSSGG